MFNGFPNQSRILVKKESVLKNWWLLVLTIVCSAVLMGLTGCGSKAAPIDLSQMMGLDKQQIIEKIGKPNEVVIDNKAEFKYQYDSGIFVTGADNSVIGITLDNSMVTKESSKSYVISGASLDSSLDANVKRLGEPDSLMTKGDKRMAIYLRDINSELVLLTKANSDELSSIMIIPYEALRSMMALNADSFLGLSISDAKINNSFTIKSENTTSTGKIYILSSNLELYVNDTGKIYSVCISGKSIYNMYKLRVGDSLADLNKKINVAHTLVDLPATNETQFSYVNGPKTEEILVNIDKTTNKVTSIDNHSLK